MKMIDDRELVRSATLALKAYVDSIDPIAVANLEAKMLYMTEQRVPKLRPSELLSANNRRLVKIRKQTVRDVQNMFETQWLNLMTRIMSRYADLIEVGAVRIQAQLEWAVQLRQNEDLGRIRLQEASFEMELEIEKIQQVAGITDESAKKRDERLFGQNKELLKLKQDFDKEMETLRQGKNDPRKVMEDLKHVQKSGAKLLKKITTDTGATEAERNRMFILVEAMIERAMKNQ